MPFYLSTIFIGRQVVLLKSDEKARPSGSSENFAVTCPSLGSHANVQPTMVPMPMSSQCRDQRCRQKGGNLGKRILFVETCLIGSCINQFCQSKVGAFSWVVNEPSPCGTDWSKTYFGIYARPAVGSLHPYNTLMVENRGTHVTDEIPS